MASVRNGVGGGKGVVVGGAMAGRGVVALAAALTAVSLVDSAYAGKNVQVDRVTKGSATFEQNGNILNIRAGDRTVINYKRFDVANNETVRFIQPSRNSRVLNRINSAAPSRIDGTITGNGIVYFVNPAGVMFGANAVINVGQFYAAAGNITDANFLNNVNQFKATGAIVNAGVINADAVALIGRSVANAGTISAEGGLVTMVAGDDIMLGTRDGHIMVKLASTQVPSSTAGDGAKGGVSNTGAVSAASTTLAAGDLYSLAIGGSIKSKSVSAVGGGKVSVTGKVDASGTKGGSVVVTGKNVELTGASIDASGATGGGTVLVGGDFQGKGETPRATNTVIDNATTITASATANGDGGKVVVWADNKATYNGSIYAKGGAAGGNGGQVEVSGKTTLAFNGAVDTSAPNGAKGSLLLDPLNLSIEFTNPDVHGDGSNLDVSGDVAAGDDPGNNSIITAGQLVILLDTTDVSLAATNDINVNAAVDASGNTGSHGLTLDAGHDVNVNNAIVLKDATLTLTAGNGVNITAGVQVGAGDIVITAGAGGVVTGGDVTAIQSTAGAVTINSTGGDVLVGSGGSFGDIHAATGLSITATGAGVTIDNGSIVRTDAGALAVTADTSVAIAQTSATGAQLLNDGSGTLTITAPSFTSTSGGVPAAVQGGGAVTIVADDVSFSDSIASTGGTVTFRTLTPGRGISLADSLVVGQLTLTGTELSLLNGSKVVIGDATAGDISVAGTVNQPPAGWGTLNLVTGGAISDAAGGTLQVDNLVTESVTGTVLNTQTHFVTTFAAVNSTSGGIALKNSGDLTVGTLPGSGGSIAGVTESGTGGVSLSTTGVLSVTGTGETVSAAGNISLSGQDVLTGGGNSPAVESSAGSVTLTATRDVILGAGDFGDVHAATGLTLTATRHVIIDQGSVASTDAGDVSVSGGSSVQILQTTFPGAAILNNGAGTLAVSAPSFVSNGGAVPASIQAAGLVTIQADTVDFTDGITSTADNVLFRPFTSGRGISLADADVTGQLTLTSTQLSHVSAATGIVIIGDATAGDISVAGTINQPVTGWDTLHLITAGAISDSAGGTLQLDNLAAEANNGIFLHNQTHFVGSFAASNTSSGGVTLKNGLTMTIGAVDGVTGITSVAGDVLLISDKFDVANAITATGQTVTFQSLSTGIGADLGSLTDSSSTAFELSQAELANVSAARLRINADGDILVSDAIDGTGQWAELSLTSGGNVSESGSITVGSLAVSADGSVSLGNNNAIGTIAATAGDAFTLRSTLNLTVGTVDGIDGVSADGQTALTSDQTLTLTKDVSAGAGNLLILTGLTGINQTAGALTAGGLAVYTTTGNASLAGAANDVDQLAADVAGTFSYADADGFDVDTVNAQAGISAGGNVTLVAGGDLKLVQGVATAGGDFSATVTGGGFTAQSPGGVIDTTGANEGDDAGNITVIATGAVNIATPLLAVGQDNTTGDAGNGGDVTLTGSSVTLSAVNTSGGSTTFASALGGSAGVVSVTATSGTITLNSDVTAAGGSGDTPGDDANATFTGPVVLANNVTVTGLDIHFTSTIQATTDGGQSLTLASPTGGAVALDGAIGGGGKKLSSLSVQTTGPITLAGGSVATTGDQSYAGPLTLGANTAVTGANVTFSGTVNGIANGGQALTITNTGLTTFTGAVGNTFKLASLAVSGPAQINGGSVATTGAQAYTGAVKVNADTTLTGTTVVFGSTLDSFDATARSLTLHNTGLATFAGAVGGTNLLSTLTIDGASAINGGVVKTTAAQTYTGPVTLNADAALTGTVITFGSTLNSFDSTARSLTLHNADLATFNGAVGASHALSSLTSDGASTLNGSTVTTTGDQTYTGPVTLQKDTTLTGDDITFIAAVTGTTDGAESLAIINSGAATFGGNVGTSSVKLESLSVSGATTVAGGGSIFTAGDQTYTGAFSSAVNLTLTGANVTFNSTVRGLSDGGQSLTVANTGLLTFNGAVGDADKRLASLTVSGPVAMAGPSISTTGGQTYNGAATVKSDLTLAGSTFLFASSINGDVSGTRALTINNTGLATFNTSIGDGASFASLSLSGPATLKGSQVVTTGNQSYGGAVILDGASDVTLTGAAITFGSTLDGADDGTQGLTLDNSAVATFGGAVGATHTLKFLTVNGPAAINGSSIATSGAQSYAGTVTVGGNATLTGTTITFLQTIDDVSDGSHTLTLANSGLATFTGAVGQTHKLGGLSVAGHASIQGGLVSTSGNQTYSGPVTLTKNTNMTASAGGVTFSQTVDGAVVLHVTTSSSGLATFAGSVGGTTPLKGLSTSGKTKFGTHDVTTSVVVSSPDNGTAADISVGGNLTVAGDVTVRVATGAKHGIRFGGDIDGSQDGQDSLTVLVPWHERTDGASGNVLNLPLITLASPSIGTRSQLRALRLNATQAADPDNIVAGTDPAGGINADAATPLVATLFAPAGLDVHVAEDFTMGRNEKLTAGSGNVIVHAGSTATVGDINAPRDILVTAPYIVLQQRASSAVYLKNGVVIRDNGLDFVAGGNIKFNGTFVETDPANPTVTFAYGGNTDPGIVRGQLTRPVVRHLNNHISDADMTTQITADGASVTVPLDFPPSGPSIEDPATTIAGATHVALPQPGREPGISAAQMALLAQIGINARELTDFEILDGLQGREMYVQTPGGLDIAAGRLYSKVVTDVLDTYSTFFLQEQTTTVDGQTATVDTRAHMREVLTKALEAYSADHPAFDPIAFRAWCESTVEQKGAADALDKLRTMLIQIEYLGLTNKEMSQVKSELFKAVKPDGISMNDFVKAIQGRLPV